MRKFDWGFLLILLSNTVALMVMLVAMADAVTLWGGLPIIMMAIMFSHRKHGSLMAEVFVLVMIGVAIGIGAWVTSNPNTAWAFLLPLIVAGVLNSEEPKLTKAEKRLQERPQ